MTPHSTSPEKNRRFWFLVVILAVLAAVFVATGVGFGPWSEESPDLGDAPGPPGERWTNSVGMAFVLIPSGSFSMGSAAEDAESHEKPLHTVTISRPFYLAATELTQAQWKAVTGGKPSAFDGESLPVEQVSWFEVKDFLRKLNAREKTNRYRLPTEAEWEYACRAGTAGPRYGELDAIAWCDPNSGGMPHPVGLKQANAWGLYDMLGNVYEWCEDWKGSYPGGSVTDPMGPSDGPGRVVRGGSWLVHENRTRSYFRDHLTPDSRRSDVGFRVVAVPPVP